uniref:Unique cartilage matrix-associated protein n=1 Tax=Lynx canadensis TaxID=61383 RepID=A0A667GCD7_LYNCA
MGIRSPASLPPGMPGTAARTWRLASGSAEPSPSALWFPNGASAHPKMAWRQLLLACCLSAAVLLTTLQEGAGASVGTQQEAGQDVREDVEQKIFMQESDASNFLKRRGKRSPKSQDEVNGFLVSNWPRTLGRTINFMSDCFSHLQNGMVGEAENRQKLRANELRREYYEEQRNEFENFVEEQNDEARRSITEQDSFTGSLFVVELVRLHPVPAHFCETPALLCSLQ